MSNSMQSAKSWIELLQRQSIPKQDIFLQNISAAEISDLCACGCNSFAITVPKDVILPILQPVSGLYCELAFATDREDEINILVFTDDRGYLCSIDVTYGACNHAPVPEDIIIRDLMGVWRSGNNGI